MPGEAAQHLLAGRPETDDDFSAIATITAPFDHAASDETVDELDHRVMVDLQAVRQNTDRRYLSTLEPLDLQEGQVLLWLYTGTAGRSLSDAQETPQLMPKIRERAVVELIGSRGPRGPCHRLGVYIIT